MAKDDLFVEFINKLKKDRSEEEVAEMLAGLLKFEAAELYLLIIELLTEEDIKAIEAITDESAAKEEMIVRFKNHTGLSPEEFISKLRDGIAKGYLFPELNEKQLAQ